MRTDDLIITISYFSIPFQILASLYQYPRLANMPIRLQILVVLFALFIFICGAGHALRCMEQTKGPSFAITNALTAVVSLTTCLYLLPLVPSLMSTLDDNLQSLQRLNEELEVSKRKLMTFMAFLCHEIRNPLFVITSNISFLEDDHEDAGLAAESMTAAQKKHMQQQEQALQAIAQAADVMLRLVNDVLDISKLESGKLELQEHDFDLRETLQSVVSSTQRLITQRHSGMVAFWTQIADPVPRAVFADSVRFLQIVFNLLSNANKFTQQGEIRFSVSVADSQEAVAQGWVTIPGLSPPSPSSSTGYQPEGGNTATTNNYSETYGLLEGLEYGNVSTSGSGRSRGGGDGSTSDPTQSSSWDEHVVLQIKVQDTGTGIPSEQVERLFQPYAQSKLANYRKHGGTGLGLAIVSKLTLAMGGTIRVQSELGRGSTFIVYLPVQVSTVTSTPLPAATAVSSSSPTKNHDRSPPLPQSSSTIYPPSAPATTTTSTAFELPTVRGTTEMDSPIVSTPTPTPTPPVSTTLPQQESSSTPSRNDSNPLSMSPATALNTNLPRPSPPPAVATPLPATVKKKIVPFNFPKGSGVVLVVDDNDMNRKLLKRMLTQFNLEYVEAADGQEAVDEMLRSRNFTGQPTAPEIGLVLMDLSMPVMDGYESTYTIRQYRNFAHLPIIALTAATIEEGKQRAMEAGVTEYQTKPIKRDALYTLCQRHLHSYNSDNHVENRNADPGKDLLS